MMERSGSEGAYGRTVAECLPIDYGGPVEQPFEPFLHSALDGSIIDRFDEVAHRFSVRPAISDGVRSLTYDELSALLYQMSAAITRAAADRAGPVSILLPSNLYFPAAILAVLAAGRAYIPLDPGSPAERNRLITMNAGAVAVISAGALATGIRAVLPQEVPILEFSEVGIASRFDLRPRPGDLAYVIYTSGSTGVPKGVYQNHRNVLHEIMQWSNALHVNEEDRLALVWPPNVISATRDILVALLNGASLHLLPPRELGPAGLVREIRARGITIYRSVPTLVRHIAEALGPNQRLESVRVVGFGADRMDWTDYDIFRRIFSPDAFLFVALGCTECSTNYAQWFVDDRIRATTSRMPVGRAVPDRRLTIVDEDGRSLADGEVGEMVVASRYLALGYWRDAELTTRAFAVDPVDPETRIFRTGDLGFRRADGLFEFVGRKDHQIKLRGHRIEPEEIESILRSIAGVRDAAIVVRKSHADLPQSLVGYIETSPAANKLTPQNLISMLALRLPSYMVPSAIMLMDELPRLPNFKIDRIRLAKVDSDRTARILDTVDEPLIREIAGIFCSVIGTTWAEPDDNVASLGGDSLSAVRIAVELESRFQISIPPEVFEATPTLRHLALWIASRLSHLPS